ncbi:MAG: hypothetical protein QM770_08800 [Tepidisphaeraceae bacterium]
MLHRWRDGRQHDRLAHRRLLPDAHQQRRHDRPEDQQGDHRAKPDPSVLRERDADRADAAQACDHAQHAVRGDQRLSHREHRGQHDQEDENGPRIHGDFLLWQGLPAPDVTERLLGW